MPTRNKILNPRSSIPDRAPLLSEIDLGEIAINTHDGKAFIKRDKDGELAIVQIGDDTVKNVYYVSKSGEFGNSGTSLGDSFKTLDSAVEVVYANQSFKFNTDVCERDLNLILNAVEFDMLFGTNYNSVTAGLAYARGNAGKVTSKQLAQTRQSINEEKISVISINSIKNDIVASVRVNQSFTDIVELLTSGTTATPKLTFPAPLILPEYGINVAKADHAANQLQQNKEFIQSQVISFINSTTIADAQYDQEKCSRDAGLIIDAVIRDFITGTNYNIITVGLSYNRSIPGTLYLQSNQLVKTLEAIDFISDTIQSLSLDSVSKSSFLTSFAELKSIIDNPANADPIVYPTTTGSTFQTQTGRDTGVDSLRTNKSTIIAAAMSYISSNFPGLDTPTCERDIGYVIDALCHDIKYGGNSAIRQVAFAYFVGNVTTLSSDDEIVPSIQVFNHLLTLLDPYLLSVYDTEASVLMSIVTDSLEARSTSNVPAEIDINIDGLTGVTPYYDYLTVKSNKSLIISSMITFVNTLPNNLFNEEKCARDINFIIDAVSRDLVLDTNYHSVTAGLSYQRAAASYVGSNQSPKTISAIEFLKTTIGDLPITGTSSTTIINSINEILDIFNNGISAANTLVFNANALSTYQQGIDRINAKNVLQTNRSNIVTDLTSWISVNYPSLSYDQVACERDTGYIIDALSHDVLYGGNIGTRINANAYFVGSVSQLGVGETVATAAAFEQLKSIIAGYTIGLDTGIINTIQPLLDIIIEVINSGGVDSLPIESEVDLSGIIGSSITDYNTIRENAFSLQEDTIASVTSEQFKSFNAKLCFRDVGLIIDAVRRDLLLGTNYNTITAGWSYRRGTSAYVLSDQITKTVAAINFARDTISAIVPSASTLFDTVTSIISASSPTYNSGIITYPSNNSFTYQTADRVSAAGSIKTQRDTIVTNLMTWIQSNYPGMDTANCSRDTGYILDGLIHDLQYGGNVGVRINASAYFSGRDILLGSQDATATAASFRQLKIEINDYVLTSAEETRVSELLDVIIETVDDGSLYNLDSLLEIETAGSVSLTDYTNILNATLSTQNLTLDYVYDTNPVSSFDTDKCYRDAGYIIDAITLDLSLGINYNSITAGLAYRRGNAIKVLTDQKQYTLDSINVIRDTINDLSISDDVKSLVTSKIKIVTDIISTGDSPPVDFSASDFVGVTTDKRNAANALQANRALLQSQTIQYIHTNYPELTYNTDLCSRDVGYIIDGITHDILFGENYATWFVANSYYVGTDLIKDGNLDGNSDVFSLELEVGERLPSVAAFNNLKTLITSYVGTGLEQETIGSLLDIIINYLDVNDPLTSPLPTRVLPDVSGSPRSADYNTIIAQKTSVQDTTLAYAIQVVPSISYDQDKCRRDVGYIVDALTHDILYGSTSATYINMRSYMSVFNHDGSGEGPVDLIGQNELLYTKLAYQHLQEVVGEVVKAIQLTEITTPAVLPETTPLQDYFTYLPAGTDEENRLDSLLNIIIQALDQNTNQPVGVLTESFPDATSRGINTSLINSYNEIEKIRTIIIRQSLEVANNGGTETTIYLKSGDYTINNPIKLPPKTSIIGDALRATTIRPKSVDSDVFWVDNGCYFKEITFRDHQSGAACVSYDPRITTLDSAPFITQSPYVQNCTSITSSGVGMRIDGSKATGLRSMVTDAFTQYNADGIGVHLLNRGYAQLVSVFTISTQTSILAETGGQCSITNSNSSFGDYGLVATGGSPSLYEGSLHADYSTFDDIIRVNGIINTDAANYQLGLGDYKRPNYNDAIKFENDSYYYTVLSVSEEVKQDWSNPLKPEALIFSDDLVDDGNYGSSVVISDNDTFMAVSEPTDGIGKVKIYTRAGNDWTDVKTITPSGTNENPYGVLSTDEFGSALSISNDGSYLAVAAKRTFNASNGGGTRENGVVYLYKRTDTTDAFNVVTTSWDFDAIIASVNSLTHDRRFGTAISLSGDGLWLAIGEENNGGTPNRAKFYVYSRPDTLSNVWTLNEGQEFECPFQAVDVSVSSLSISDDGTDLVTCWNGPNITFYYYTRGLDNFYVVAQSVNIGGDIVPLDLTATSYPSNILGRNLKVGMTGNAQYLVISDINSNPEITPGNPVTGAGITVYYTFAEGSWSRMENVFASNAQTNDHFGTSVSINRTGDIVIVGQNNTNPSLAGEGSQAYIVERAATNWSEVSILSATVPQFGDSLASSDDRYGFSVAVGGTGDYVAVGSPKRLENQTLSTPVSGALFTYYSILDETGSYILNIAPPLNKDLIQDTDVNFHQRSLITSSSHTFEYVGSGTNTFTAVPQNGGIPNKAREVLFDSADTVTDIGNTVGPNFGLVYFTATDELGDFRIGGELTINREAGTITGTTFDRSLFAVLTPYILALEG